MTLHDLWSTFHSLWWLPCQWCDKLLFHVSAVSRPSFCQILSRHPPLTSTWTRLSKSLEPLWGNRGLQDSQSHCPTHPERWLCDIPLNAKSHRRLLSFDPFFELGTMLEQESLQSKFGTNTEKWLEKKCLRSCFNNSDQSACALYVHKTSFSSTDTASRLTIWKYQKTMEEGVDSGILSCCQNLECRLHGCKPMFKKIDVVTQRIFQKSLHAHQIPWHHLTDSSSKSIARQKFNCNFCTIFASTHGKCRTHNRKLHCREHRSAFQLPCASCKNFLALCGLFLLPNVLHRLASPTSVSISYKYWEASVLPPRSSQALEQANSEPEEPADV